MNSKNHIGACGELFACQWFLTHNLEVFRNVASSGPADIFVWDKETGKGIPVDIKSYTTVYYRKDGNPTLGVRPRFREDDGVWQVAYVHGEASLRLPEGFWEALDRDG